jgi:hypothetical protein
VKSVLVGLSAPLCSSVVTENIQPLVGSSVAEPPKVLGPPTDVLELALSRKEANKSEQ